MPSTKSERKEDDRPQANNEKRFLKSSNVSASSNANETKQMQNNNCPQEDVTRKIWNCPMFKSMNVTEHYAAVRKERLCYKWMYQKAQQTATLRKLKGRG